MVCTVKGYQCLYYMLVKFEQNRMIQTTRNNKTKQKQKTNRVKKELFGESVDAIWKHTFVAQPIVSVKQ